jgi:hypothetical protein
MYKHTFFSGTFIVSNYIMKRFQSTHVFLCALLILIITGLSKFSYGKEDGAPSGNTGSPGDDQTCAHVDCHTGSASEKDGLIATDVPASGYLVGETYLITVTIEEIGITRFGFQASPQNLEGDEMGEMALIDSDQTKFTGGGKYITHTNAGTNGVDSKTWTFNWTPEEASGDVTFYVAVNASDDEDDASGDHIYTSSVTIAEDPDNHPLSIEEMNDILFDIHGIVKDELAVTVSTPVNNPIVIDIIDIHGRLVLSNKHQYANGTFIMPVDNLTKGMYFVRISNAQGSLTKQFFKN